MRPSFLCRCKTLPSTNNFNTSDRRKRERTSIASSGERGRVHSLERGWKRYAGERRDCIVVEEQGPVLQHEVCQCNRHKLHTEDQVRAKNLTPCREGRDSLQRRRHLHSNKGHEPERRQLIVLKVHEPVRKHRRVKKCIGSEIVLWQRKITEGIRFCRRLRTGWHRFAPRTNRFLLPLRFRRPRRAPAALLRTQNRQVSFR